LVISVMSRRYAMYRVVRDQSHALVDHLRGRLVGAFRPDLIHPL